MSCPCMPVFLRTAKTFIFFNSFCVEDTDVELLHCYFCVLTSDSIAFV